MSARLCAAVCSNSKYISRLALENCDEDGSASGSLAAGAWLAGRYRTGPLYTLLWPVVLKDAC